MNVIASDLSGVLEIRPKVFSDERGFFVETWQSERYCSLGLPERFVQDNHSFSVKGTLRKKKKKKKFPQGKLIYAVTGEVFDVVVDIRRDSPTFGSWCSFRLSEKRCNQLWIPPGFAHGFLTLSPSAHIIYKCTDFYHPEDEGSICWNDPTLSISWPLYDSPLLSKKDAAAPSFSEVLKSL